MAFYVPQDGRESRTGSQTALLVRNPRLGANYHNAALENTYNPPLLPFQRRIAAQSSQLSRSYLTSESGEYFSTYKMAEEYRTMTDQERVEMDLEIRRIRLEEMAYIFGGIPLDASHGERIAMRQHNGINDPLSRFRPRRQPSSSNSDTSSSFSQSPESGPSYHGSSNSVAVIQVISLPPNIVDRTKEE